MLFEGDTGRAPEEQYASKFGRALLTPARAVMQKFSDLTAGASKLTRRHIIVLAHSFGVSREAMVRRLEELELAKRGTWDWFQQHGGISNQQAQEVLGFGQSTNGEKIKSGANALSSLRLAALAAEAWRREILSEGQLSSLLRIERSELRAMFASGEIDRGLMDDE